MWESLSTAVGDGGFRRKYARAYLYTAVADWGFLEGNMLVLLSSLGIGRWLLSFWARTGSVLMTSRSWGRTIDARKYLDIENSSLAGFYSSTAADSLMWLPVNTLRCRCGQDEQPLSWVIVPPLLLMVLCSGPEDIQTYGYPERSCFSPQAQRIVELTSMVVHFELTPFVFRSIFLLPGIWI